MLAATSTASSTATSSASEPLERVSLEVESAESAWSSPGFRVATGYSIDVLFGVDDVPDGVFHDASLRLGARLDPYWSLFLSLVYGARPGVLPMLTYRATVEPTLHLSPEISISLGAGLGGIVISNTGEFTPEPDGGLVASLTIPSAKPLLGACSGAGFAATARIESALVMTELLSMGPSVSAAVQWTRCVQSTFSSDLDTGESIDLVQLWQHTLVSVGWTFWWR